MSFFSGPSKYLSEALLARRARQRQEAHEEHLRQRRALLQRRAEGQHVDPRLFGALRIRRYARPLPIPEEDFYVDSDDSSSIHFKSNWKSIGAFFTSIFSSKQLTIDSADPTGTSEEDDASIATIVPKPPPKNRKLKYTPSLTTLNEAHDIDGKDQTAIVPPIKPGSTSSLTEVKEAAASSSSIAHSSMVVGDAYHVKEYDKLVGEHSHHPTSSWSSFPKELQVNETPPPLEGLHSKQPREIPDEIEIPPGDLESVPSEPISYSELGDCWGPFRCHRYTVSKKLVGSCARQSLFLKRVMSILSLQYLALIIWLGVVMTVPVISQRILDYFNYSYIPLGIFLLSKLLLRSMLKIRKFDNWVLILIECVRVICISYYCGAVTAISKNDTIFLTAVLLQLTHSFFALTAKFVDYDVRNSEIIGMGAVVNLMFSIMISFPYIICHLGHSTLSNILLLNWLPSFVASQFISMILIFDMKQIMTGWRFPLTESDWMFTVLYV